MLRDADDEWRSVAALAGVEPAQLRRLHQVHGREVVIAGANDPVPWTAPEADAILSRDAALALVVRVADCAPILMVDRRLGAVAAVHAGWRSTLQQIAPSAVASLTRSFGTRPDDLIVAVGPALGRCCGEMGDEVVDAFRAAGHDEGRIGRWFSREQGGRAHFDLWRANREQLEAAGVPAASIHVAQLCTKTHPAAFHSYRAAGPASGRMAAVIRASSPRPPR